MHTHISLYIYPVALRAIPATVPGHGHLHEGMQQDHKNSKKCFSIDQKMSKSGPKSSNKLQNNLKKSFQNQSLRPSWGLLGVSWGLFPASWACVGPVLGASWAILGGSWAVLGPSWAVSGPAWAVLGPSWAVFGRFWGPLGPSWDDLWSLLGRFRPSLARTGENPKNLQKPLKNQ